MALSEQQKLIWDAAQVAEKGHWALLWLPENNEARRALVDNEIIKAEFIFQYMIEHFGIKLPGDWAEANILDVGCGPLSLIARNDA